VVAPYFFTVISSLWKLAFKKDVPLKFNISEDKGNPSGREQLKANNSEKKEKPTGSIACMVKPLVLVRRV